ncbi:MAG: protein kinase [Pirellulaceae bacterium]
MSPDYTQQQSVADQQRSKDLSLQRSQPPTEVPGYQAQRFLGAGAYGEVWFGVDRNTGRKVAIKFYAHRRGVDWSLLSREVEKLVFLSADRYVVQLLEVGWNADPPYYVMEYVENGSLDDLLRQHGTFAVPEAVEMFREIAVGLAHAHGKGVLHCDIKPANILLDQDHRPRLADFGQSRLSHEQKPALGTLFYMAPEQADLEAVPDVGWDVYALGAILYCLLIGHPPHRNDATVGNIDSASDLPERLSRYRQTIRSAPPAAEHRKLRGMDRALADIVDRCLAADPQERFANVQEVLDALADRDRNRARLPLLVLGFAGPLLVVLVTAFFSYRGYERAVDNAEALSRQWALENNQFAADLAAEKVTGEIGRYFEIAREEADRPALLPHFFEVLASPSLARLSDPQIKESEIGPARDAFQVELARRQLDHYLMSRLKEYDRVAQRDRRAPRFASIFVTDQYGTQLAAAFDDESPGDSIGTNRAHRAYFHGGPIELPPFERVKPNASHIERTHLSAVFKSNTQGIWKIAISTPIFREIEGKNEFSGILVLTVALGDFDISRAEISPSHDRFAVLVDGREGDDRGTILQHPLFTELLRKQPVLDEDFVDPRYRVSPELLAGERQRDYVDPLGLHRKGKEYDRRWLAAAAPVLPPVGAAENSRSGLVVLVQSDYQSVVAPARQLGEQFVRNSFWMLIVMATVSLGLWYVVVRIFREPRPGLRRKIASAAESTPLHGLPTLAAPNQKPRE